MENKIDGCIRGYSHLARLFNDDFLVGGWRCRDKKLWPPPLIRANRASTTSLWHETAKLENDNRNFLTLIRKTIHYSFHGVNFFFNIHLWNAVVISRSSNWPIIGCECDEATSNSFSLSVFFSVIWGESKVYDWIVEFV